MPDPLMQMRFEQDFVEYVVRQVNAVEEFLARVEGEARVPDGRAREAEAF